MSTEKQETTDELILKFLAKGGKIKKVPPGEAQNIFKSGVIGTQMKK